MQPVSPNMTTFDDFLPAFFNIFTNKSFRGKDFPGYLTIALAQRKSDEAAIVDNAIVAPLLKLLGFEPAEQTYNQQRSDGRPDFAPTDNIYGICFIVEDKNTSLSLNFDLSDPHSHLSQLSNYVRASGVRLGWLTNGQQFTVWSYANPSTPKRIIDLDTVALVREWTDNNGSLSATSLKGLQDLFDLCRKFAFTELTRLEQEIAVDEATWAVQALPLDTASNNQQILVETLQTLIKELQRDVRRVLDGHLTAYEDYNRLVSYLSEEDVGNDTAQTRLAKLRQKLMDEFDANSAMLAIGSGERRDLENVLLRLEQDPRTYISPAVVQAALLAIINPARAKKYAQKPKEARPLTSISAIASDTAAITNIFQNYTEMAFGWHQRQASLRQKYRTAIRVQDDYSIWTALVKETMLGGLDEAGRREEFALQTAYVVFIRLLLIRVCEDKGIFRHRFVSDGGLSHWQEDIERYLYFASGNPYDPLLDMAYSNAQNIYAHFFTGRELFNWYKLDRKLFIMTLHRLSRFNFAGVDSDIVGTIYSTYVSRKEKREKGQYYTPPEIVNYILDEIGYQPGPAIIGSNKGLIDPACGSGSFLVSAAKRLVAAYQGQSNEIENPTDVLEKVRNNLFGFDLNPFACYLAEVNLLIQVLDLVKLAHSKNQYPRLERFHIYNVDALARPTGTQYYTYFNTFLAEESDEVDRIKRRDPQTFYGKGFAFVVANPPYGAKLSDEYIRRLRTNWPEVFGGHADTYTFFFSLGLTLLAKDGKLGFITPNTFLMGVNTEKLRGLLLNAGRIEQIVDLPQGIWDDANVDCVLLFLTAENDEARRKSQQVQIKALGLRDKLDRLVTRQWVETFTQNQSDWLLPDTRNEMNIRQDALLDRIEVACSTVTNTILGNGQSISKILRLGDVTESSQGIKVYETKLIAVGDPYIKPDSEVSNTEKHLWKRLLDSNSHIGRYELRWGQKQPYLKYGNWLERPREPKFFASPKLLLIRLRNKALKRRLVATYDDTGFYNRDNYSNIIESDASYNLKYILALLNSALLNYWYSKKFDNVTIVPAYFRQIPIHPANTIKQAEIVKLVDAILGKQAELNYWREQDYLITKKRDGSFNIVIPFDRLLKELQKANSNFPTIDLVDAKAQGLFTIPASCDQQTQIGRNVFISNKYPTAIVLRSNKLWIEVPDAKVREYLLGYLSRPIWQGKTLNDIRNQALIPEDTTALDTFLAARDARITEIKASLDEIHRRDAQIDEIVLNLYGITNPADRQRILGSIPEDEDESQGVAGDGEGDTVSNTTETEAQTD